LELGSRYLAGSAAGKKHIFYIKNKKHVFYYKKHVLFVFSPMKERVPFW
jgi:hypothetical protein